MAAIAKGSTIGILGGGQLGRMLAQAATKLGYKTHIYCPDPDSPAFDVSDFQTIAAYNDVDALKRFAKSVAVVTYEFENIPATPVMEIARHVSVLPSPDVLATSQHRVKEKTAVQSFGIATAPFMPLDSLAGLKSAVKKLGTPAVLKTASMGYDGKGQVMIQSDHEAESAWQKLMTGGNADLILEGFVDFVMEISVIVARTEKGEMKCYVPVQNIHKHHILSETIAPAPIPDMLAEKAESVARTIAEGVKLVGILAVEMFVTNDHEILVNELAPRPHNSGHWTMDACTTSQFEQTVRAICGLPLGSTHRTCDARMINLIGDDIRQAEVHAKKPDAKVHLYGKKETRPGRKMGHVTFLKA